MQIITLCLSALISVPVVASPLYFRTLPKASQCMGKGTGEKAVLAFYKKNFDPKSYSQQATDLANQEAKERWDSLECMEKLKLSILEKSRVLRDWKYYESSFADSISYYENYVWAARQKGPMAPLDEPKTSHFLETKKDLFIRLNKLTELALQGQPVDRTDFESVYLALILLHVEFFATITDSFKEYLLQ